MDNQPSLPIQAVLFDLDDTLFDHLNSTRQGLLAICQVHPFLQTISIEALLTDYMRLLDDVHLRVLTGEISIDEARIERFSRFFQLYCPTIENIIDEAERAAHLHRKAYQATRQVVAGSIPLLEYLHGKVKIAIVTNNIVAEQKEKLQYLKLNHLVDALITSEETGSIKPDPRIFHTALERLGCRPENAVMVGDSWQADILGARQASIRAIWLNRIGITCPDPDLAQEIRSLEPLEQMLSLIIGETKKENAR